MSLLDADWCGFQTEIFMHRYQCSWIVKTILTDTDNLIQSDFECQTICKGRNENGRQYKYKLKYILFNSNSHFFLLHIFFVFIFIELM